jgi:hypothetical protein
VARVPQVRRIIFNDEEIGMGFNSETGLAVGTALEGFMVQENLAAPGMEVTSSISIVNTHEELMETMGMSFEAQGRYGFFSASAKAKFAESSNYNSTSTFVVARCVVENPFRRGKSFRVTAEAQSLLDTNRFEEFKTAFGDCFVRGLQTGGEFYAVIRVTSASETTQSSLSFELQAEANGLVAAGSFKGKFDTANQSANSRSEYVATMYQKAGAGPQIAPTVEIDEVIARFKAFPQIAQASAAAYETEIATYDTLPLPLPTSEEQEDFLLALADAREQKLRFIQTRNDLQFALRNPAFFEGIPEAQVLNAAIVSYTRLINGVIDHAVRLSRGEVSPAKLFDPSALAPPIFEPAPVVLRRKPEALPEPVQPQPLVIGMSLYGVALAGGWRDAATLNGWSAGDIRNLVITELSFRTRIPVAEPFFLQRFNDAELIGKAALYIFSQRAGFRTDAQMREMTTDDLRNMVIVENDARLHLGGSVLQSMDDQTLVNIGLGWFNP